MLFLQWRIQDFEEQTEGATREFGAKTYYLAKFFSENCMKMKEIGLGGGGIVRP